MAWMERMVLVLIVGCGPQVPGSDSGDGDGDGDGDGSTSDDPTTGEPPPTASSDPTSATDEPPVSSTGEVCPDLTNEEQGAGVTVTIRNDGPDAIYLIEQYYCFGSYLNVRDPADEEIEWRTDGWYVSCEELAGPTPSCGGPACKPQTVRIDPGGTWTDLWTGVVFENNTLEPQCAQDDVTICGPGCFIVRTPEPGSWTFEVEAMTGLECGDECGECEGDVVDGACVLFLDPMEHGGDLTSAAASIEYPGTTEATVTFD